MDPRRRAAAVVGEVPNCNLEVLPQQAVAVLGYCHAAGSRVAEVDRMPVVAVRIRRAAQLLLREVML
jgi:hypothetical protein